MRLVKRFYALITILLFLSVSYFFLVADKRSTKLPDNKPFNTSKEVNRFIKQLFPNEEISELNTIEIEILFKNRNEKNVIELEEVNIHQVSLIYQKNGILKAINWFKCKPSQQIDLSTKPFFILNREIVNSKFFIVYNKSPLKIVPLKLYEYNDFLIGKAVEDKIKTVIVIILLTILLVSLFTYFMIGNFYSIMFSIYLVFCLLSNLVYSGFANNFWPFNISYVSDHFLGLSLSSHLLLMSCFLVYLVSKMEKNLNYYLSFLPLIISSIFLFCSIFFNSFILLKYLLVFAFTLCFIFTIYYPKVFSEFKNREAYWFNYCAILCFMVLFILSSLKYLDVIGSSTILNIIIKTLFLSHIVNLFFAFVLISKNRIIQRITTQIILVDKVDNEVESFLGYESIPKILGELTEKEYIVLEFIAKGLKDQEIADRCYVSLNTIKTHKQRLYKKLEINNRSQATQLFLKND